MSAHDQMRTMLDELMGTGRDGEIDHNRVKFDDPRVCKSFLLLCCPHDILSSTRMDLGECPKIHDPALRADYDVAAKKRDYFYDIDALEHLENFINDCDRKTELAKKRLKESQEELSEEANAKADSIHNLGEQIGTKLAKAEEMGADGNVEESLQLMDEVEELKKAKSAAEADYRNSIPASRYQQQKLRVCDVCSAYLGIHDNDRQLADHFGGKLHLGFIQIRDKLAELKETVNERIEQRDREREQRRWERDNEDLRNRDRRRSRSRDYRRRSRSREHRRRRRSRSRSRNRRSRSRDRYRRQSRSRSSSRRKRSHRSRSRSHSKRPKRSGSKEMSPADKESIASNGQEN